MEVLPLELFIKRRQNHQVYLKVVLDLDLLKRLVELAYLLHECLGLLSFLVLILG